MMWHCSYLFSSDWFPELRLLEKAQTLGFHNNIIMPWYNNQSFVSICFQRQKRWRKSEFNLFSKAKALAPSQNEGNSGSGTLETAVLFGLRIEWNDFFLMHGHILFCVLILKFKSYFVLLGNFVFSNTIQDVKNVIFKVVVGQNHIQYSNHDLKTPTLNIFQFFDRIFIITHHGWGPSSWRLHRCIYLYMFWSDHHLSWLKTFQLQAP